MSINNFEEEKRYIICNILTNQRTSEYFTIERAIEIVKEWKKRYPDEEYKIYEARITYNEINVL